MESPQIIVEPLEWVLLTMDGGAHACNYRVGDRMFTGYCALCFTEALTGGRDGAYVRDQRGVDDSREPVFPLSPISNRNENCLGLA